MRIYECRIEYNLVSEGVQQPLDTSEKVMRYLTSAFNSHPMQEQFLAIPVDRKNKPYGRIQITLGTATSSLVHAREVFKPAILASATAVILGHNHPSGDPAPSRADIQVTRQMREAGRMLGIDVIDHVIVGRKEDDPEGLGYYSFNEAGLL